MAKIKTKLNREVYTSLVLSKSVTKSKIQSIWDEFDSQFNRSLKNEGKVATLNRYKECYLFLSRKLLDLTYPTPSYTKVDTKGIPKPLWPLRPLIKGDRNAQRIALTIARRWESIYLDPIPNLDPIISSRKINLNTETMDEGFELWIQDVVPDFHWLKVKPYTKMFKVWDSNSSGPNGPAVTWALADLIPLKKCKDLWNSIQQMNTTYNRQVLNVMMDSLEPDTNIEKQDSWVHSSIGFISEPGGKTRLFSIFDYWSQSCLIPLHHQLMELLRTINQDATHDQNKGFKTLIRKSRGKPCFCFDLSSATDRIPAFQQKLILKVFFGETIANAWFTIMTERTFRLPNKTTVRWKVGQPLGALTSFPAFALWHHMVVQYAYGLVIWQYAKENNLILPKRIPWFTEYRLLGDDIVIWNAAVATAYQKVMNDFGLEINLKKTIIGRSNSQLEFLKRISKGGIEMSSIKHTIMSKEETAFAVDLIDLLFARDYIETVKMSDKWLDTLPKGKAFNLFKVVIWYRYLNSPSISIERKGKSSLVINRADFSIKLKEVRTNILTEKTTEIDALLCANTDLATLYQKWGAPYRKGTLGEGNLTGTLSPIVWVINQTGEILGDTLNKLWDEELVATVEYIPLISNKRYFKKINDKNIYLSRVYEKTLKELWNEATD